MKRDYNKVEILKKIKKHLNRNHPFGLCMLLSKHFIRNYNLTENTIQNARELRIWIMNLLAGSSFYSQWIRVNGKRNDQMLKLTKNSKYALYEEPRYLEGRHQWLDWMIELHTEAYDMANDKPCKTNHITSLSGVVRSLKKYKEPSWK